jgi:hypothetical protein
MGILGRIEVAASCGASSSITPSSPRHFSITEIVHLSIKSALAQLWMMDHAAHLRGTVKREQVGELTILTPNTHPRAVWNKRSTLSLSL